MIHFTGHYDLTKTMWLKYWINLVVFASGPGAQPTVFIVFDFCFVGGTPPLLLVLPDSFHSKVCKVITK